MRSSSSIEDIAKVNEEVFELHLDELKDRQKAMNKIDYSKWDNIGDSSDSDGGPLALGDGAGGVGVGGTALYDTNGRVQIDKYRDVFDESPDTIPCSCPLHRVDGNNVGDEALPVDSRGGDASEGVEGHPEVPCRRNIEASGDVAFKEGEYAVAIEYFTKALTIDPTSAQLFNKRSVGYLTLGDLENALVDARQCCRLQPLWFRSHLQKAMALRAMSRFEQAMQACKIGLRHEPNNPALRSCLKAAQRSRRVARETYRKERKHNNELGITCCSNGCQDCAAASGHTPAK